MGMLDVKVNNKNKAFWVIITSVFWYAFAHGYRMCNNLFSHDSLIEIVQDDSAWQISLGRVFHPILIFLRGGIVNPWLVSIIAMAFIAIAVYLVTDLLEIDRAIYILAVSGLMVANPVLVSLNIAFVQCVDFYMLALMLSVLGVWLINKEKIWTMALGILCIVGSLGIYQSYICISFVLVLVLMYKKANHTDSKREFFKLFIEFVACILVSAILYIIVWKLFQKAFNIWTSDSYNGMSEVANISVQSLPLLIIGAYSKVFEFFASPTTYVTMMFRGRSLSFVLQIALQICNIIVLIKALFNIIYAGLTNKRKLWVYISQTVIVLLIPLAANFVFVMSKGMEHTLMIYAFIMLYVIALATEKPIETDKPKKRYIFQCIMLLPLALVIWTSVVYANQAYLKNALKEKAIDSLMTRVVYDIEHAKDYVPGQTPVAISGSFEKAPCIEDIEGFEDINPYGTGKTILTYLGTDYSYIKYEMAVPLNKTRVYGEDPEIKAMPVYPSEGSVRYVNDVLVIKIAEEY